MSKNTKIIIGVIAGLLVLCLIACGVGVLGLGLFGSRVASNVIQEGEDTGATQAEIAEVSMPARFTPDGGFSMLGIKMIMYKSTSAHEAAMLIQMPVQEEINDSTVRQLIEGMQRSSNRSFTNLETIEERDATIRGKPAKIIIQEGTDNDGDTMRMMMTAFQGKSGIAMLMIFAPPSTYNQADYDTIVKSIR
jgi:hypothetical protein